MKHFLLTIIFTLSSIVAMSQYRYSIENCWEMAKNNYPSIKHLNLIEKSRDYTLSNTGDLKIPQDLSTSSTNNSSLSKQNTLNTLGSNISSSKLAAGSLQANLFILSERVNNIFFSLILIDKHLKISEVSQLQIVELTRMFETSKDTKVNSAVNIRGMKALEEKLMSDYRTLKKMQQLHFEMLSLMTGKKIDERTILLEPNVEQYFKKASSSATNLIDNNRYNPFTSTVNTAPKQSSYTNNSYRLFETAKVKVGGQQKNVSYTLDELKKSLLNVDIDEQRSNEYTEISNLCLEIEKDRRNIDIQREIIVVSYNKILRGVSDISNLTQGIINYLKTNRDFMSHNVQLMMTANKFNFLFH